MRGGTTAAGMAIVVMTHFQVHPLLLDLQDHLNHLQNVGQLPLPVIHVLLKGLDVA